MNRKTSFIILGIITLNLLVSCTKAVDDIRENNNRDNEINESIYDEEDIYDDFDDIFDELLKDAEEEGKINNIDNSNEQSNLKKDESVKELAIDDRCIGCGKCAIISPNNFSMDYSSLKAVVTSQKDMFSGDVSRAIQHCPTDSITIG